MRIKLNKLLCLLAILALLCCGVALADSEQPVISIDNAHDIMRGEYAEVKIVGPVSGEGINFRAYILYDESGELEEENILADCGAARKI